jgi:SpoVK/Ycf46/Vps4 family AAA+-type ATPase
MATADQLKALIRSHADGDQDRFYSIAMQVAAQAARNGHSKFAQELRDLVDNVRGKASQALGQQAAPIPMIQPRGELVGLLTATYPKIHLANMTLASSIVDHLQHVLLEQRERERIRAYDLSPLRKLLLVGPPGTGKTMSAAAIAGELEIPLFTIQLDGLITKFLGETASKLRLIFDAIQRTRAVFLFDEFDALGGERTVRNDVGEIRRVLNSFLQFLEVDDSDSIIVAATNHPDLLDRALFRRFDDVIEYLLPIGAMVEDVMRSRLALLDTTKLDWKRLIKAAEGLSHADIARACEQAAKRAILAHRQRVDTADLMKALKARRSSRSQSAPSAV